MRYSHFYDQGFYQGNHRYGLQFPDQCNERLSNWSCHSFLLKLVPFLLIQPLKQNFQSKRMYQYTVSIADSGYEISSVLWSTSTAQKWSFPWRISSISVSKSVGNSRFGHIYWKNPSWKTSFFVQWRLFFKTLLAHFLNQSLTSISDIANI